MARPSAAETPHIETGAGGRSLGSPRTPKRAKGSRVAEVTSVSFEADAASPAFRSAQLQAHLSDKQRHSGSPSPHWASRRAACARAARAPGRNAVLATDSEKIVRRGRTGTRTTSKVRATRAADQELDGETNTTSTRALRSLAPGRAGSRIGSAEPAASAATCGAPDLRRASAMVAA